MAAEFDKQSNNKNLKRGNPSWGNRKTGNGKSGNRKGRPRKEVCITSELKKLLLEVTPITDKNNNVNERTGLELVALAWFQGMLKGNPVLLKEALDRIEGKAPQELTGEGGGPIRMQIEIEDLTDEDLANIAAGRSKRAVGKTQSKE